MIRKILTKNIIWLVVLALVLSIGIFFVLSVGAQNENLVYGDSDVPVILPRASWNNTPQLNALMTWTPSASETPSDWQPVERIIIHHSATPTVDPVSAIVRIQSIYRYHAVTQGWGDIGYNYSIDQQGNIYEGRYGGNGVRGAHVFRNENGGDNFNYGSIGIVLLGDYSTQDISQTMRDSLDRLVGWLATVNNLDPQKITTTTIWNKNKQAFVSFFNGYTVLGHKDIENTICPGIVSLTKVRQEAVNFKLKYDGLIYQLANSSRVYAINNGTRKTFLTLADYVAAGGSYSQVVSISQTQLDLFSETRFLKYPDGSLLQINGAPKIYLIDGGKKRSLDITASEFTKLSFNFALVKNVGADDLVNYPNGVSIKYGVDKELLSDGTKVYLMQGGKKHWVTSGELFNFLGLSWKKVKQVGLAETEKYLEGDYLKYSDGTLLRDAAQATVYLIKDGQKHEFVSAQSFLKGGRKWSSIILTSGSELALYPSGEIVKYADGTLIKSASGETVYLVDKGLIKPILSVEIFQNLHFKWEQILIVSDQELAYYAKSDPVKYLDGTLLRAKDENTVYLIANGTPQPVDAAIFKARKYKWSQVLVIAQADFNNLYRPTVVIPSSSLSVSPGPSPTPSPSLSPLSTSTPTPSPSALPITANPKIRVAIFEVTSPGVTLTANAAFNVLDKAGQIIATKNANENFIYSISDVRSAFIRIVPQSEDGVVQIVSYEDHPAWKPSLNYNQFHGTVEIVYSSKSNKIWAVNELLLEDYLKGVAETSEGDAAEYQKAMAVAARTYAQYYIQKGGKRGLDEVYILNNTTSDQLYKGYAREILAPSIVQAVNDTRGEIMTYNGN
ncbi:N-acetylmuramoyl-L-alanine amidase, partial [Patescibacteria group bacterium]|nr:N-acetylmuramoyl-L-alanine amidase [Patescibacteria group bacterium]